MTKKDKKAIEEAFIRISAKDPHCSSCIFRTEWEHIGKLLRNILENNQPSRRKGHWLRLTTVNPKEFCNRCSECGYEQFYAERYKFCPNCGCRMVEPQESEDKG